jgi:hypothetical protein
MACTSPTLDVCSIPDFVNPDAEIISGFLPFLRPSNERQELVLFCVAWQLRDRYPDIERCSGCKYNILSQSHHINCSTAKSRRRLSKADFSVDVATTWQLIFKMKSLLPYLAKPTETEVDLVIAKCNDQWRNLVIAALLYELENFPQEWLDCIKQ